MNDARRPDSELEAAARSVCQHAHAPHSGFRVGAALRDGQGGVHIGCNVESDSYGLTQCAERNAIGAAIASGVGKGEMTEVVIYVPGDVAWPPCGACRQVMVELLAPEARITTCCDGPATLEWTRESLLSHAFTMDITQRGNPEESA